jgi:phosphohistidine phosphatase SixA
MRAVARGILKVDHYPDTQTQTKMYKYRKEAGMLQRTSIALLCALCLSTNAFAQGTIFLVRHAERADTSPEAPATMAADPSLSDAGRVRAASLAAILKDAGISAIFVTEFKRTQETAAPLAKALGITPTAIASKDAAGLIARLKQIDGTALVVGHSNTVPDVVKALGVTGPVSIGDADFDNLFILTPQQPPRLIRLHYR